MLTTFHNDPVQKLKYKTLYSDARESGHMIRGEYYIKDTQKGCLIGLAIHGDHHTQLAVESGIPEWLLRLGETCFEGLPEETFTEFPERLMDAIPVGIDHKTLEPIKHKMAVFQIQEICCNTDHPLVKNKIDIILSLHKRYLGNNPPSDQEWFSAAEAARSAARSAAYSAAHSAARSAAHSAAAESTAYSARSASYSAAAAAESAAAEAAYSAARSAISEKLLSLLQELEKPITKKVEPNLEVVQ